MSKSRRAKARSRQAKTQASARPNEVTPSNTIEEEPIGAAVDEVHGLEGRRAGALSSRLRVGTLIALWTLLLLGIAWRFVGLNWDAGHHLHPDERFLTMTVPRLGWPDSLSGWFNTSRAPHNPFNLPDMGLFVYGQLPLLLAKFMAGRMDCSAYAEDGTLLGVAATCDTYEGVLGVGRFLSALTDAGTVLFTLLIARRLLGGVWGLVAGVLLAFTALHIQHAHFFVVDPFATFFIVASLWAALKWREALKAPWALLAGVLWGLALACKISSALFAPALGALLILPLLESGRTTPRPWRAVVAGVLLLGLGAFWCFRVGHPMAFRGELWGGLMDVRPALSIDPNKSDTFWESLAEQQQITVGERDVPWNLQWFGRRDFIWPARNLLVWAVGWQLMLPATLAALALLWRFFGRARSAVTREDAAWLVVVGWALACFAYYGGQYSKFSRYFLVLTPFIPLLGAWMGREVWRLAARQLHSEHRSARARGWALRAGAAIMVAGTVLWGSAVASIYTREHTRVAASRWIEARQAGTRIANESVWDDTLPLGDKSLFEMLDLKLLDVDNEAKRANILDVLDRADWIVISSPRLWTSVPRLSVRHPLTTRYYHALFSGELRWKPEKQWASYPQLNILGLKFDFPDDDTEEALTVYDHPRVMVFRKTPQWSRQRAEELLPLELTETRDEAPISELRARGVTVDETKLPWLPHLTQ